MGMNHEPWLAACCTKLCHSFRAEVNLIHLEVHEQQDGLQVCAWPVGPDVLTHSQVHEQQDGLPTCAGSMGQHTDQYLIAAHRDSIW